MDNNSASSHSDMKLTDFDALINVKDVEWGLTRLLIELIPGFIHDLNNVMAIVSNYRDICASSRTRFANTQNSLKVFNSILKNASNTRRFLSLFQHSRYIRPMSLDQYFDQITHLFDYKFAAQRITVNVDASFPYCVRLPEIFTHYLIITVMFYLIELSAGKSEITIASKYVNSHVEISFVKTSSNDSLKSLHQTPSPLMDTLKHHVAQCNRWLERLGLETLQIYTEKNDVNAQNYIIKFNLPREVFQEYPVDSDIPETVGSDDTPLLASQSQSKLLIIDDEKIMCDLLLSIFEDSDMQLDYALDGQEAIDKCKHTRYDLIICDYMLPGITAVEIIDNINKISEKTKFIVITGCADLSLEETILKPPVYYVLRKPFRIDEILSSVQNLLS